MTFEELMASTTAGQDPTAAVTSAIQHLLQAQSASALSPEETQAIQQALARDPKYANHPLNQLFQGAPFSAATTKELQDVLIRQSIPPEQLATYDSLPPEEQAAMRSSQLLTGQSAQEQDQAKAQAQFLIDRLIQNGLDADSAVKLQQAALVQRGDGLTAVVQSLQQLADAASSGIMGPDGANALGARYAQEVDALVAEGRDLATEFGPRMRALSDQAQAEIPGLRDMAGEFTTLGRQMGDASSPDFYARWKRRFDPILMQLDQEMRDRDQGLIEAQNTRGVLGGTDESYSRALLTRERNDRMARAALESQAMTEGQQVSEYGTRGQIEPGIRTAPFQALLQSLEGERARASTGLEIHAARGNDVAARGNQITTGQNVKAQGVEAAKSAYDSRLAEMEQANQRFGSTYGTALSMTGVPQSNRLQIGADAATNNLSGRLGYQAAQNRTGTERTIASRQMPFNMLGAGIGAMGAMGAAFLSDPATKTDIRPEDGDGEEVLEMFRDAPNYRWKYKDDPAQREHVGMMSTDLPDGVAVDTPEGRAIDVPTMMGELKEAVLAVDNKLNRLIGKGFRGLANA